MKKIGLKIYELRKSNGLKQKELASRLGLTPKMISFYEHGERIPSRDVLCNMSDIFGVSVDYLLGITEDPRPLAAQAREKFGFYIPYQDRERYKNEIAQALDENPSLSEQIELYELEMKVYFSRSVDQSAFNFSHVDFPEFASMLLHQQHFKERYGEAHPALCAKYPPKPGISESKTHYIPSLAAGEAVNADVAGIVEMIKDMPPRSLLLIKQFVTTVAELG